MPRNITRSFLFIAALLVFGALYAAAATPPRSYTLDVTFDPERSFMEGTARMRFGDRLPPDSLVFYLHGELDPRSATAGSSDLDGKISVLFFTSDYSLVAKRVALSTQNIAPSEPVTITYDGYFHPSKARSPSDYMRIDADGVFLRSFGYSVWFPVFAESDEDPGQSDFDEVVIRTPEQYRPVFAGKRLSEEVAGGERVSRWSAPGTRIIDAQCTARPFEELVAGGVHLLYLPNDSSRANAREIGSFSSDALSFFAKNYGGSDLTSQAFVVEMPRFGDISSNNMTGIASGRWRKFTESESALETVAHELVHPFVHISVPLDDPLYALVVEGFPSYFHYPFLESRLGADWYSSTMDEVEKEYRRRRETGLTRRGARLPAEKALTQITPDEIGIYKDMFVLEDRALLFLHSLRRHMGEQRFGTFTHDLFSREKITFDEFLALVAAHAPDRLDDVRAWLTGTDFPERFSIAAEGR